jgi:biopolymer transport protein ExbD
MAGMADVVLLLLIFFLLTSSFVTQFGIQVNLPRAESGSIADNQQVSVTITSDGTFYVEQEKVTREGLLEAVRTARGTKTAVALRADQDALIRHFAEVANIAKALNMRILMATERELPR